MFSPGQKEALLPSHFKSFGKGTIIYPQAKIVMPENIEIGEYCKIDDFTFIYGGKGIKLGNYVHIASFVSIIGGGILEMDDYSALTAGVRIITGTNLRDGGYHMSASSPIEQQNLLRGKIIIEKDGFIGTNAVILPNVTIGEGAIIGACSLVNKDVEPWTINVGIPCKVIGKREKVKFK